MRANIEIDSLRPELSPFEHFFLQNTNYTTYTTFLEFCRENAVQNLERQNIFSTKTSKFITNTFYSLNTTTFFI